MAQGQKVTVTFAAEDKFSGPVAAMAAAVSGMIGNVNAAHNGISQMAEAGSAAVNQIRGQADAMAGAAQSAANAADTLAGSTERLGASGASAAAGMSEMAAAAYEAAGADAAVVEVAAQLGAATEALTEQCASAQEAQNELNAAMSEAEAAFEELNAATGDVTEAQEMLVNAMDAAQSAQEELTRAQEGATAAQQEALEIMQSGTATMEEIQAVTERVVESQAHLAEAEEAARGATEDLVDATDEVRDGMAAMGEESDKAGGAIEKMFGKVGSLVGNLAKGDIGAALEDLIEIIEEVIEVVMECVEAFATFEEGLAKVSTIADTSQKSMQSIRQDLMQLSMDTGTSVNELLDAEYQALSASVETAKSTEFVATASQLAAGGFTSTATAVDVLTTAINAYGLSADDATSISDMLIQTQNAGKTTVDELASAMGRVIPVAQAYGVDLANLCSGYVQLTKTGINTAESTTYLKSMFNELGDAGSQVGQILVSQTGQSFAQLMASGMNLGEVIGILGDAAGGSADALNGLFSSSEAGSAAVNIYSAGVESFTATLDGMANSAGNTASAFATMENTTADALEDLSNAFENLHIAAGEMFAPIVTPITQAMTSIINLVTTAISKIGGLLSGLLAPVFEWVCDGISWVCDSLQNLIDLIPSGSEEYRKATPIAKDYADTLDRLQGQYDGLVDRVGEEAAAQSDLAVQLGQAQTEYSLMSQTMDDYMQHVADSSKTVSDLGSRIDEQVASVQTAGRAAGLYVDRITQLATKSNRTASETKLLAGLVDQLNEDYAGLNVTVADFEGITDRSTEAIRRQIDQMNDTSALENYSRLYAETSKTLDNVLVEKDVAEEMLASAQKRFDNAEWWEQLGLFGSSVKSNLDDAREAFESYSDQADYLEEKLGSLERVMDSVGSAGQEAGEKSFAALSQTEQGQVAAATAFQSISGSIQNVIAAYDEAYDAARESILGQISLFDEFTANTEISVSDMINNLRSQNDAAENWAANLANIRSYLESTEQYSGDAINGMMGNLSELSEDTAGAASALSELATAAASGNEDAQREIAELMTELGRAEQNVDTLPDSVGNSVSGAETALDGLTLYAQDIISGLNLEPEAQAAATQTIGAWIGEIQAQAGPMKDEAFNAANGAASDIIAEFSRAATEVGNYCTSMTNSIDGLPTEKHFTYYLHTQGDLPNMSNLQGNAKGTRYSADMFIAGEEGPELIMGARGSRVYNAHETRAILDALSGTTQPDALNALAPDMDAASMMQQSVEEVAQPQEAAEWPAEIVPAVLNIADSLGTMAGTQSQMLDLQRSAESRSGIMDPSGAGWATRGALTQAQFMENFGQVSDGLGEWIAGRLNRRQGVDGVVQDRSLDIARELMDRLNIDPDGQTQFKQSGDPFRKLDLNAEFAGVSDKLGSWIADRIERRGDVGGIAQERRDLLSDFLRERGSLDPSGGGPVNVVLPDDLFDPVGIAGIRDALGHDDAVDPSGLGSRADDITDARRQTESPWMDPSGGSNSTLEISLNGKGAISVTGSGMSPEEVAAQISKQIADESKDVLLEIIKQEAFTEGERHYVY
ncbi:phage tail tape measure protein [bacterium]|nr:phage tail tape measure protein [bacterium]